MAPHVPRYQPSAVRRFLQREVAERLTLVASAALAPAYRQARQAPVAGLSVTAWINDGPMSVFFLPVGLEIKRGVLHGRLRTWAAGARPGLGAVCGMVGPALVFALVNQGHPPIRGWASPGATDIAVGRADVKIGVLPGSPVSATAGERVLRFVPRPGALRPAV